MTQRYRSTQPDKDKQLIKEIKRLAFKYNRFGYRRIAGLLRKEGWQVNNKRVYRIWRQEHLKIPQKCRRKRRLGSSINACHRRKAEHIDHIWSYDFMADRTEDGRRLKLLAVIDEFTRECLYVKVARSITSSAVTDLLEYLFMVRGVPEYVRSDNGPEFIAGNVRSWLEKNGSSTLFVEPGSPWENGYIESFNSKLRDELLNAEMFFNVKQAQILVDQWRNDYNHHRPHSSIGYLSPAKFAATCTASAPPPAPLRQCKRNSVDNLLIASGT